jgi:peptidoglycan-associated lipoprotein
MKMNNSFKLGAAVLLSVLLAACSSSGSDDDMSDSGSMGGSSSGGSGSTSGASTGQQLTSAQIAEQEREAAALRMTVFYFDFDQSELKPEAREALVYHANQLKANPNMRYRLEGHADERGTREYNLALGERRAQAVERYLIVQGVSSSQLETISYGEEVPAQPGNTEASYRLNRRVEIK